MSRDPQTVRQDDPRPDEEETQEPIRTLLWTAATIRPLDEVAALVSLLRRTGEVPSPADEALKAAAVARPLDEVRQLVLMLNEPPEQLEEADATLRAAAVGRPIEDVAELVNILGTEEGQEAPAPAAQKPAAVRPSAPEPVRAVAQEKPAPAPQAPVETPAAAQAPVQVPAAPAPAAAPAAAAHRQEAERSEQAEPRTDTFRFVPPTVQRHHAAPAHSAPRTARPESARRAPAGTGGLQALHSVLRWPAGAALIAIGLVHLPKDLTELRSGGYADAVSLVVTVLCLFVAVWLMVQDMVWTWAAGAVASAAVLVIHSMVGFGSIDLPESSLGGSYAWARAVALVCAIAALALSGSALMRRRAAVGARGVRS
ncbi:hypothetical protein AB0910_22720 [Streptomyces sp. NPDC047002]|uniref:hypothetical protein n=1 Tax=Streptomyces sp. NPDC047002 TaxID=3155475 RepID=UPI0034527E4D